MQTTVEELKAIGVEFTDWVKGAGYDLAAHYRMPGDFEVEPNSFCKKKEFNLVTSSYEPSNIDEVQEFIIDYAAINGIPCDERFKPEITFESSPGAELVKAFIVANPETGGWRVFVQLKFTDKGRPVDLSLKLLKAGRVVSETWTYFWQP